MRKRIAFGGEWTEEKLARVEKYLKAYLQIFESNTSAQFLSTWYVDGFASGGYRLAGRMNSVSDDLALELDEPETDRFRKGSVLKALELNHKFDHYLFVDLDANRCAELEQLKKAYVEVAERIKVVRGDANSCLLEWCKATDWRRNRALLFLDPYGMQVRWPLLEAISQTKAIDLWLLFPFGVAVNRMLTRNEPPPTAWGNCLTGVLGTADWRQQFYVERTERTLFGEETSTVRDTDLDRIGRFFVNRLETIFPAVAQNPLMLRNSKGMPLYLLCFATANPKATVIQAALRIAGDILRR